MMRTIDARHLDVSAEELLEYLSANVVMNIGNSEQQIIITPSQLENIEEIHHLHVTSSMGYMCTFRGVPVMVKHREPSIQGRAFPEPIIDESEAVTRMFAEYARIETEIMMAQAKRIEGEYVPKKPKAKVPKEEVKQQGRPRHMPVWKD